MEPDPKLINGMEEPQEAPEADIAAKLQGVLVDELSPINTTLQVLSTHSWRFQNFVVVV